MSASNVEPELMSRLSDMGTIRSREPRIDDVAGVSRGGRLEDQDVGLRCGQRPMLDASRHDDHLAGADVDGVIAEFDRERAVDAERQLVLGGVVVPDELTLKLHELYFLAIERADDPRPPVLADERELVPQVDLVQIPLPPLLRVPPLLAVSRHILPPCRTRDAMSSARPLWARWPLPPVSTMSSARRARPRPTLSISWRTTSGTRTSAATGARISGRRTSIASRHAASASCRATRTPRSARRRGRR